MAMVAKSSLWLLVIAIGVVCAATIIPAPRRLHRRSTVLRTWPNAIVPFEISDEFEPLERKKIRAAIDELHRFSCVRWIPREAASPTKDYVYFTPGEKKKCSAHVGRVGMGRQLIQLAPHCFDRSTILHELMHSLGFHHEHARHDRDPFIEIVWPNIDPNHRDHFRKHSMGDHTFNTPYDFNSVMHYDSLMGTGNGEPTILKQQSRSITDRLIDPASTLSLSDAVRLNQLYECDTSRCEDRYPFCHKYAAKGWCQDAAPIMRVLCKRSCGGWC